jgi:dolichyl-phosphate beta-glucosyltransferase
MAAGILAATGELTLLCDADRSTPFADIGPLHQAVTRGADVAIGSRAAPGGGTSDVPVLRRLGSRAFNVAVRLGTGMRLGDTQRGFKLVRTDAVQPLCGERLIDGFAWDVELLLRAQRAGLRIEEVGVRYRHDPGSTVRLASAGRAFLDVLSLRRRL